MTSLTESRLSDKRYQRNTSSESVRYRYGYHGNNVRYERTDSSESIRKRYSRARKRLKGVGARLAAANINTGSPVPNEKKTKNGRSRLDDKKNIPSINSIAEQISSLLTSPTNQHLSDPPSVKNQGTFVKRQTDIKGENKLKNAQTGLRIQSPRKKPLKRKALVNKLHDITSFRLNGETRHTNRNTQILHKSETFRISENNNDVLIKASPASLARLSKSKPHILANGWQESPRTRQPKQHENTWTVQPRIHRIINNPNKLKKSFKSSDSDKVSIVTPTTDTSFQPSTVTVESWLQNSVRVETGNGTVQAKGRTNHPKNYKPGFNSIANRTGYQYKYLSKAKRIQKPVVSTMTRKMGKRKSRLNGSQSEIPVLYSDEDYDVFPLPRPLTDTARDRAIYNVYGPEGIRDLRYRAEHVKFGRTKGQLVKFYRNGDQHFKGAELVINRDIRNFETLLSLLTDKIPTPSGVRYIFELPEGRKITSLREFRPGRTYVVSGLKHLNKDVNYGESLEKYWSNQRPSASRVRKSELELFQRKELSPKESTIGLAPLLVPIINYSHDKKMERILLNPHTTQTFEEWLYDISTGDRPIRCLFTDSQPHTRIQSFSQLFKELKNGVNFIATAEDYLPVQYPNKREAPSSNSSSDSVSEKSRKKKLLKRNDFELSQIHELNSFEGSDSVSLPSSRQFEPEEDPGPQYNPAKNEAPLVMPNEFKKVPPPPPPNNSVQIDIAGRLREFYPPTDRDPYDDGRHPDKMLKIDWVYGYRGKDTRYNLVVLPKTGEMMYFVASVVVLYDKDQGIQRHYTGHNEEITCMTLHPNEYLVATGQMQGKAAENGAHIRIWHGISLSTYSVIGIGAFLGGVISIGFSMQSSGNFMCALDNSNKHILSVWEWQTERIIARTTTSMEPVIYGNFFPEDDTILITFGSQHIYFWKLFYDPAKNKDGRILRDRNSGIFQDEVPKYVCCIAFTSTADVITGDTNGNLLLWAKDESDAFTCKLRRNAHKAPVTALCMLEDGTLLSGSGYEIKAWDSSSNYIEIKSRVIPDVAGDIQKIVPQNYGGTDGKLYIGTSKGCILEGSLQYKFKYLVQSQGEGLTALVSHPQEPTFVTCGLDQLVIKWSQSKHDIIWKVQVEKPCTCLTIEKRTQMLVLGTTEGRFIVLNAYNGMHVASVQSGTQQIKCIEFSPDGIHLALGCNDGLISVYSVSEDTQFRKVKTLRGHTCAVQNLDWSSDSLYLQSVDEDLNVCFWDVGNSQQIKQAYVLRDMDWNTHNSTIAYNILGTWTVLEKGEQVNTVSRSNFRDLVLTGDDLGRIRLYKYPASKSKAEHLIFKPYSGNLVALTFSFDDTTVISCGGIDTSLIQWNVVDSSSGQ
ncbi:hypothetical protein ACJMK2_007206 [Sinanodonta woodiana]|uniref:Doublecortin domain-containing protein n=1 Tax=Sinanodonta woodiana TaxID=1069815 RepID=A0ABD3VHT9_SINWO